MGLRSNLREKSLLVKEKWPIVLTRLPAFAIVTAPDAEVLCSSPRLSLRGPHRVGVVVVLGID
jgi:hypothetical protein